MKLNKAGRNDWPSQVTTRPNAPEPMTYRTVAYFAREYRKRFDMEWNLSRAEALEIIRDADAMSDEGVLSLLALHSRVNDHAMRAA
jgi:hypothetical protein